MSSLATRKVLWAVDPFLPDYSLNRRTARAVAVLAAQWGAEIQPVYIYGDPSRVLDAHPLVIRDLQADGENRLGRLVSGLDIPERAPLFILESSLPELRSEVDELILYAKKSRADLIAVGTRARKGLERLFQGSFAETLIHRSDVPLYVVNPHESIARRHTHILYATDFSKESQKAFERVIEFARELGASLTIYHVLKIDDVLWGEPGMGIYPTPADLLPREIKERSEEAARWVARARAVGIQATFEVDRATSGTVSDAIVDISSRRATMIAMAAHSGPLTSAILGSVSRQVIRTASCPVWLIHTEQRKAARGVDRGRGAA